jgi:hypothetical protein
MDILLAHIVFYSISISLFISGFVRFNKPPLEKLTPWGSIYDANKEKLIALLRRACDEITSKEGDISVYSSYASNAAFADHIKQQIELLEQHDVKESRESVSMIKATIQEVYEIFLPTSDWDDAGGSMAIANEIVSILNDLMA